MRSSRKADVLPEEDEELVNASPEFLRELFLEFSFRFLRGFCGHKAPAVRDAVDMGINTDCRLPKGNAQNQVGRFPPHSGEPQEFLFAFRDLSPVFLKEDSGDLLEPSCLFPVKSYGIEEMDKVLLGNVQEILRFCEGGHKALQDPVGCSILSPVAQEGPNENKKGVFGDVSHRGILPVPGLFL